MTAAAARLSGRSARTREERPAFCVVVDVITGVSLLAGWLL